MATVRHLGLFPFCVSPYPPNSHIARDVQVAGPLTEYPFKLPILLCTRMWWTVKHWQISLNYAGVNVVENTKVNNMSGGYIKRIELLPALERTEKALVCQAADNDYEFAATSGAWLINLPNEATALLNFYTNWDFQQYGFGAPFARSEDEDDKANLWVAMSLGIGEWESFVEKGGPTEVGTFRILDTERQFLMNRMAGDLPELSDVVIEPYEFWEYDPGDGGGPIYDSQTGAQLRAFPS
jgi:hypothetical protein